MIESTINMPIDPKLEKKYLKGISTSPDYITISPNGPGATALRLTLYFLTLGINSIILGNQLLKEVIDLNFIRDLILMNVLFLSYFDIGIIIILLRNKINFDIKKEVFVKKSTFRTKKVFFRDFLDFKGIGLTNPLVKYSEDRILVETTKVEMVIGLGLYSRTTTYLLAATISNIIIKNNPEKMQEWEEQSKKIDYEKNKNTLNQESQNIHEKQASNPHTKMNLLSITIFISFLCIVVDL